MSFRPRPPGFQNKVLQTAGRDMTGFQENFNILNQRRQANQRPVDNRPVRFNTGIFAAQDQGEKTYGGLKLGGNRPRGPGPNQRFGGPRGGFNGPRGGNFNGPRGNFNGPRGNFGGPRGNFDGPRGNFDGPRGNFNGPRGNFNSRGGGFSNRGGFGNFGSPRGGGFGQRGPPPQMDVTNGWGRMPVPSSLQAMKDAEQVLINEKKNPEQGVTLELNKSSDKTSDQKAGDWEGVETASAAASKMSSPPRDTGGGSPFYNSDSDGEDFLNTVKQTQDPQKASVKVVEDSTEKPKTPVVIEAKATVVSKKDDSAEKKLSALEESKKAALASLDKLPTEAPAKDKPKPNNTPESPKAKTKTSCGWDGKKPVIGPSLYPSDSDSDTEQKPKSRHSSGKSDDPAAAWYDDETSTEEQPSDQSKPANAVDLTTVEKPKNVVDLRPAPPAPTPKVPEKKRLKSPPPPISIEAPVVKPATSIPKPLPLLRPLAKLAKSPVIGPSLPPTVTPKPVEKAAKPVEKAAKPVIRDGWSKKAIMTPVKNSPVTTSIQMRGRIAAGPNPSGAATASPKPAQKSCDDEDEAFLSEMGVRTLVHQPPKKAVAEMKKAPVAVPGNMVPRSVPVAKVAEAKKPVGNPFDLTRSSDVGKDAKKKKKLSRQEVLKIGINEDTSYTSSDSESYQSSNRKKKLAKKRTPSPDTAMYNKPIGPAAPPGPKSQLANRNLDVGKDLWNHERENPATKNRLAKLPERKIYRPPVASRSPSPRRRPSGTSRDSPSVRRGRSYSKSPRLGDIRSKVTPPRRAGTPEMRKYVPLRSSYRSRSRSFSPRSRQNSGAGRGPSPGKRRYIPVSSARERAGLGPSARRSSFSPSPRRRLDSLSPRRRGPSSSFSRSPRKRSYDSRSPPPRRAYSRSLTPARLRNSRSPRRLSRSPYRRPLSPLGRAGGGQYRGRSPVRRSPPRRGGFDVRRSPGHLSPMRNGANYIKPTWRSASPPPRSPSSRYGRRLSPLPRRPSPARAKSPLPPRRLSPRPRSPLGRPLPPRDRSTDDYSPSRALKQPAPRYYDDDRRPLPPRRQPSFDDVDSRRPLSPRSRRYDDPSPRTRRAHPDDEPRSRGYDDPSPRSKRIYVDDDRRDELPPKSRYYDEPAAKRSYDELPPKRLYDEPAARRYDDPSPSYRRAHPEDDRLAPRSRAHDDHSPRPKSAYAESDSVRSKRYEDDSARDRREFDEPEQIRRTSRYDEPEAKVRRYPDDDPRDLPAKPSRREHDDRYDSPSPPPPLPKESSKKDEYGRHLKRERLPQPSFSPSPPPTRGSRKRPAKHEPSSDSSDYESDSDETYRPSKKGSRKPEDTRSRSSSKKKKWVAMPKKSKKKAPPPKEFSSESASETDNSISASVESVESKEPTPPPVIKRKRKGATKPVEKDEWPDVDEEKAFSEISKKVDINKQLQEARKLLEQHGQKVMTKEEIEKSEKAKNESVVEITRPEPPVSEDGEIPETTVTRTVVEEAPQHPVRKRMSEYRDAPTTEAQHINKAKSTSDALCDTIHYIPDAPIAIQKAEVHHDEIPKRLRARGRSRRSGYSEDSDPGQSRMSRKSRPHSAESSETAEYSVHSVKQHPKGILKNPKPDKKPKKKKQKHPPFMMQPGTHEYNAYMKAQSMRNMVEANKNYIAQMTSAAEAKKRSKNKKQLLNLLQKSQQADSSSSSSDSDETEVMNALSKIFKQKKKRKKKSGKDRGQEYVANLLKRMK